MIVYGWEFSPKRPKRMSPKSVKVYTTGGAHMKTYLDRNLFVFWGIDAKDKIS